MKKASIIPYFAWIKVINALAILSLVLFNSCHITYKVRNQNYDIEEILYLPCGKVTAELVGKGNSKFVFKQRFDLDTMAIVQLDSLYIYYNDTQIKINHNIKGQKQSIGGIEVLDKLTWDASFELEKGVFEGDTILVYAPNYIQCNMHWITLDTMIFSFANNLRIFGVNEL